MNGELIRKIKPFAVMPMAALSDARLEAADKVLFCALWSYAGETNEVWPKHEALSERVGGIHRGTIIRSLERLREAGWITWTRGKYGNRYVLSPALPIEPRCSTSATSEGASRCCTEGTSDDSRCSSDATSESGPDVANSASRCAPNATSDVANCDMHIRKNHIQEPELEPSSSSSSEAAPPVQQEEDEDRALVLKKQTGEPEDVSELVRFIGCALESSTGQKVAIGTGDARRTRAKAPNWTITEIVEAFAAYAKSGKPQTTAWFPKALADIYERLEGKPPEIPTRCAHGLIVDGSCAGCERDETERRRAEKHQRDAELEARGICPACRNSGRVKSHAGWEAPCGQCELGKQLQAHEDAEERRRNQLCDRFEPLRRRIEKLSEVKRPWEIVYAFTRAGADRREEICIALERDCSPQTVAELMQPRDERKTA